MTARHEAHPTRAHRDTARDRILHGSLVRAMGLFGTPLALGMGLQTTFNLVDSYIISRLGSDVSGPALGAIGICDQIAAIGTIMSYGVSVATAAMMAQRHGRGDLVGVRRVARRSMLLVAALAVVFGLAGAVWAHPVIHLLVGAKGKMAELAVDYLRVITGGSFTVFLLLQITSMQRALGSSKTPVAILLSSNVLNFLLAVLLVYGPGEAPPLFSWGPPIAQALGLPRLELVGAAWATVLARAAVLLPLIGLVEVRFRLLTGSVRMNATRGLTRQLLAIAWPASCQLVVRVIAMLLTQSLVARTFTTAADQRASTALGVVFRLETLALFVALGWGSAAQTFLGQNLGAGHADRALRSGWVAALYNASYMAVLALAAVTWARDLVGFFDRDPIVLEVAAKYLSIVSPSYVLLGFGVVLGSAITGAGATRLTLAIDTVVVIAVQLPLSVWATVGPNAAPGWLWAALVTTNLAFAVAYLAVYRGGRFLRALR